MEKIDTAEVQNIVNNLKAECSYDNIECLIEFYYPLIFDIIKRKSNNDADFKNNIESIFFGSLIEFCERGSIDPVAFKEAYSNTEFEKYDRWSAIIEDEEDDTLYNVTEITEPILLLGYLYTFERALLSIGGDYTELTLVKPLSTVVKLPNMSLKFSNSLDDNVESINTMLRGYNSEDTDDQSVDNAEPDLKGKERCKLISGIIDDITATLRKIVEYYSINEPLGVFGYENGKPVLYTYNNGLSTVVSVNKVDTLRVRQFINNLSAVVRALKLEPVTVSELLNSNSDMVYSPLFAVSLMYHKGIRVNKETHAWELYSMSYDKYIDSFSVMIKSIFERVMGVMDNLFTADNEPKDVNTLSSFVEALCNRLSNFFAVEQYNGYSMRISARVGVFSSNKEQYSIINTALSQCQSSNFKLLDNGELNVINSGYNGVLYSSMVTTNRDKFYGETFFAYKMYEKRIKLKKYPKMSSLILGQANNGTDCTVNMARPEACIMNISAGTRQGKGVLTLNLLSCILATGGTICYCDAKPDMASMLWDIERTLRAESGVQDESGNIFALECHAESTGAIRSVKLGTGLPSNVLSCNGVKSLIENVGVLAQFKVFQLLTVLGTEAIQPNSSASCNKLLITGSRSEPIIVIVDEMRNMSESLKGFISAISYITGKNTIRENGGSISLPISSKDSDETKELYNALRTYVKFIDSVRSDFTSALNASITKTNFIKIICLGQKFATTKTAGATVAVSVYKDLLSLAQIRIYGGGGAVGGAFGYNAENEGCKEIADVNDDEKNKKVSDTADKIATRKFVLYDSKEIMTKNSKVTAFKPYFVLNENNLPEVLTEEEIDSICSDITQVNGCTGQFLTNVKESNREYVLKEELTNKGDDNLYHRNDAVGFLGLIQMLLNGESAGDILHRFNIGYKILWSLVNQCGIAKAKGYKNLEQYLYDCSLDSFYNTEEIINAIKNGEKIGVSSESNSKNGEKIGVSSESNSDKVNPEDIFNTNGEQENSETEKSDEQSPYDKYADGYTVYNDTFVCRESNNIFARTYNDGGMMTDLLSLREASLIVLQNIEKIVGDLSRVRTLEFDENGIMVINNIVFKPTITREYASTLPFDIRVSVEKGQWSELFNFKDIYKFKNLGALRIDNWDLAEIKLRNELGYVKHDWFKIKQKLKRKLPLQQLVIMGVLINEQDNVSREKINNVSRRNSFVNSCKNAFKAVGGKAASFVHSSHAQNIWVSKPVKFVRKALGWTLGTQAILWSVSAFGFVGLLGGAIAVASTLRNKDK